MGSGTSHAAPKEDANIVIVGGGYGGITLAGELQSTVKTTLISPEECFFHKVGALRSCVEPDFANMIFIPFKKTFGDSFVQGKVLKINKEANSVTLDSGEEIRYSHLVLAAGASGSFPSEISTDHPKVSRKEGMQLYKAMNKEIMDANTVACIGGGAVGVEMAAEIKTDFPNKNVIIVHSGKKLCSSRLKPSAQTKLQSALRKKGIQLILEDRVENLSDLQFNKCIKNQVVKTQSGKDIEADLIFRCLGSKPAIGPFMDAVGDSVTSDGHIKVDKFLMVHGANNIFAIGDINDVEEEKMAVTAIAQAEVLAKNMKANLAGKEMTEYNPGNFVMIVPVGRDGGVAQIFGMVAGDFVSKTAKSKGLFTSRFWGQMRQKPPNLNGS